ncbi:uncharacterized protein LOC134556124 [Prinia subflava]|uniref:uncharacterized protein LOC134556124 n=1 Tax=Prinia subflava TaxID=208062 RepID=UPI002FE0B046
MWEFELDSCGKSSWSGGVLLASGMERMERAGSGYIAACTGFGVISLRSSQGGNVRELCSLRGVKSLCDVTLWMLWAEKGKGFFPRKAYMVLCDHGPAGRGWLEAREEVGAPGPLRSTISGSTQQELMERSRGRFLSRQGPGESPGGTAEALVVVPVSSVLPWGSSIWSHFLSSPQILLRLPPCSSSPSHQPGTVAFSLGWLWLLQGAQQELPRRHRNRFPFPAGICCSSWELWFYWSLLPGRMSHHLARTSGCPGSWGHRVLPVAVLVPNRADEQPDSLGKVLACLDPRWRGNSRPLEQLRLPAGCKFTS